LKLNDGLAGFQHLDTPVRTQDLTGHPGHQKDNSAFKECGLY
jgi:hypothetical protein